MPLLFIVYNACMEKKHNYITPEEVKQGCRVLNPEDRDAQRICVINEEFKQGFEIIESQKSYKKSVSFFGSARFKEDHPYYEKARSLAKRIGTELGYAITSGGGGGIMEAANRGGFEAGVPSLGITIKLPHEQATNPYVTQEIPFYFFFSRKVIMTFSAEAYIFFPGGFGTMDEFFEIVTLIQTKKIVPVPVILFGSDFWTKIKDCTDELFIRQFQTVDEGEVQFMITDSEEDVLKIVKEAPLRK